MLIIYHKQNLIVSNFVFFYFWKLINDLHYTMVWKLYTLFSLPRCLKEIYSSRIRISSCRFRDNSAVAIQRTTYARSLSKRGVKATT